jgi:hypothetical protein
MATFTLVANLNLGDETTSDENLVFRIYDNGTLIHTTGSAATDPNVSIQGNEVTIVQVPSTPTPNLITITAVDEAKNESEQSNYIDLGDPKFYADGFYEAGFYENATS